MKLWLLRPNENLPKDDNPWNPWYAKAFGFVVRSESEDEARALAHDSAGDENRGEFMRHKTANTRQPWLEPRYSSCVELSAEGGAGVIIIDYASA